VGSIFTTAPVTSPYTDTQSAAGSLLAARTWDSYCSSTSTLCHQRLPTQSSTTNNLRSFATAVTRADCLFKAQQTTYATQGPYQPETPRCQLCLRPWPLCIERLKEIPRHDHALSTTKMATPYTTRRNHIFRFINTLGRTKICRVCQTLLDAPNNEFDITSGCSRNRDSIKQRDMDDTNDIILSLSLLNIFTVL
jgi:hypothetical protein